MKLRLSFIPFLLLVSLGTAVIVPGIAFAGSVKVAVCHVPPGNPENFHTITIGENALSAHLAHGDLGEPCDAVCAALCDDGDACTIDDSGDCELNGCPVTPELVDCNDQNECTADSCDAIAGCVNTPNLGASCDDEQLCSGPDTCNGSGECVGAALDNCCLGDEDCSQESCAQASCNLTTNRCGENPVVCVEPDLCSISQCASDTGLCVNSAVVCGVGEECSLATGDCVPVELVCPCWTSDELAAADGILSDGTAENGFDCYDFAPNWLGIDEYGNTSDGVNETLETRAGPAGSTIPIGGGYCIYQGRIDFEFYVHTNLSVQEGSLTEEQADACYAALQAHYNTVCN